MNTKVLFSAEITDGYSLRNSISMIKNEQDDITLLISKKKICITFLNKGENAVHDILINTDDLHEYHYNIPSEEYSITVNTTELLNATKPVGRKDSLKISLNDGSKKLNIQPIKSSKNNGRASVSFISIINKECIKYDLLSQYDENDAYIKIQNREFSDICAQATTQKCNFLEITANGNIVTFKGVLSDGSYGMVSRYVATNTNHEEEKITKVNTGKGHMELNILETEEVSIKLPSNSIKTMAKLHNIAPTGTELKFIFAAGKPIKIESKIGTYGNYVIYLRNFKTVR